MRNPGSQLALQLELQLYCTSDPRFYENDDKEGMQHVESHREAATMHAEMTRYFVPWK